MQERCGDRASHMCPVASGQVHFFNVPQIVGDGLSEILRENHMGTQWRQLLVGHQRRTCAADLTFALSDILPPPAAAAIGWQHPLTPKISRLLLESLHMM